MVAQAVDEALIEAVQRRLVQDGAPATGPALATAVRAELTGPASDAELLRLIRVLQRELTGAGVLQPLLADPATTDVVVNGPDDVRVDRGQGWEPAGVRFADDAAVQRLARRLATAGGRRLDDAQPFADARLPDGTRLHAVLAPLAASGTALSLRVLRPSRFDLAALAQRGMFPGVTEAVLRAAVRARLAFLVTGGTGAGKTTLLGALLGAVPATERIVLAEDAEELRPDHPHLVRLVSRPPNLEGSGAIPLRELVRQALRMRPDRLVVGEVRGGEVVELLVALNTGHDGGAGTVHANSPAEVPARLEALAAMAGLPRAALHAQLAGAVQLVLQVRRTATGRQVGEIAVLHRDAQGWVAAEPAVRDGRWVQPGGERLGRLLHGRGVAGPWPC
jgi:pilus assembly protein CpaF